MDILIGGGLCVLKPLAPLKAGHIILGHRHNFGHVTVVNRGSLTVAALKATVMNVNGWPARAEVDHERIIKATDRENWFFIEQGVFHMLRVEEDDTDYGCFYANRLPQALSHIDPGRHPDPADVKRDEHGALWVRVDESIVQHHTGWADAYR